jgi:hypothetical protein
MLKRLGKEPLDPGALLSQLKQAVFVIMIHITMANDFFTELHLIHMSFQISKAFLNKRRKGYERTPGG